MTTSRYLHYLPAVLQEGGFLGDFLRAFECLLSGLPERTNPEREPEGIEQKLDRIHTWFDPLGEATVGGAPAPADFLPWLADWVAVSLRDEWSLEFKRAFIRRAVSLHRKRGTLAGMQELLRLFLGELPVEISESAASPAHFFRVSFTVPTRDPALLYRMARDVRALIDAQKPAHTFYGLAIRSPALRLSRLQGQGVTVGRNTLLGTLTPLPVKPVGAPALRLSHVVGRRVTLGRNTLLGTMKSKP